MSRNKSNSDLMKALEISPEPGKKRKPSLSLSKDSPENSGSAKVRVN